MDYQKINSRWIYRLTLSVFGQNLVTYVVIAILNTVFAVAQGFVPFMGIGSIIAMVYLGGVSFMVAHRTILQEAVISPGDALAFTGQSKTYFWQYLFISGIPVVLGLAVGVALYFNEYFVHEPAKVASVCVIATSLLYYVMMAFFGTSLVATAVGGDGMMMVSRGRVTFFYSLSRMIVLPSLVVVSIGAVLYLWLSQGAIGLSLEGMLTIFGNDQNDVLMAILLLSVVAQLMVTLLNLIAAVIVTKAFLLAEVRLALKGEPTEWGKQAFGISEQVRTVVYK